MRDYKSNELYPYTKILSSSQFLCYEKDPWEFYLTYEMGCSRKEGPALKVGRVLAEAYADREYPVLQELMKLKKNKEISISYDVMDRVCRMLPLIKKAEKVEHEVIASIGRGWKIRATLDGYNPSAYEIIENKSGLEATEYTKNNNIEMGWDQERVNFSDQITFQALAHRLKFKVPPSRIVVNYINMSPKAVKPLESFRTTRGIRSLEMMQIRVEKVIEGIEAKNWTQKLY